MKTIQQKAKAYDEALEKAKKLYEKGTITESIGYIFPELKESEDEKIRKHLISLVKNWDKDGIFSKYTSNPNDIKQILAWLEKQGEKPQGKTAFEAIKEKPADNANKVASAWNNGYSNGYIQAIDKACEWLENHNDYIDVKDGNVTYFDMKKCVEDFRKAMKGGEE